MKALNNISNSVFNTVSADGVNGLGFVPPMESTAGNAFDIDYVKVSDVLTDEKNFQNRQDKYSEKSVEAIIKAVKNGAFNWFAFDPVLLWQAPDGKKYVLSGHSRTEAFRRLSKEKPKIKIDGLTFDRIPAKIYKGDFVSAKNLALNSNALATPETLLERADYYRKLRQQADGNDQLKKLREKALRENQGSVIWDLSYIPKGGLTDDFLRRFKMQEDSPNAFENYIRAVNIASWIGKAFQIYKGLGKLHDTELFNFLNDNYGTRSGEYNSFAKLNERLQVLYPRNVKNDKKMENGIYTTPFGLQVFAKTDEEVNEIEELKKLAETAKRDLKRKIDDLRGRTTDKEKVFEIVTPYFNIYINALLDWWRKLDTERKRQEDKNQTALFGLDGVKKSNAYDTALLDLFNDVQQLKVQFNEFKKNPYSLDYGNLFEQKYTIDHRYDDFITNDVFKLINEAYDKKIKSRRWYDINGDTWYYLSNDLINEMTFYLTCFKPGTSPYKNAKAYLTQLINDYPERKSLPEILKELRYLNDVESFRKNRPIDFERRWSVEYYNNIFDDAPVSPINFNDVRKVKVNMPLSGLGVDLTKRQPSAIFNCPDSMLDCKGFSPTYTKLADYSPLIDTADGVNKFVGTGFDKTTLNTLVDTCQKYYPQVSRLAAHLADPNGDELQTCFNIWHWEHNNLRYDYDAPGKEEIRTPARTWQDRHSGVDCDCLAVFTACLLLNLGYHPKFEIVGFGSTPKYSHIYVNQNGAAIDRVLPNFLQRAPLITKTMYMEIPVYQLSGLGSLPLQVQEDLNGIYRNTLSKVFTHTATPEELLDFRKTQVLVTLGNVDPDSFKIAGIVMPYVEGIDDQGAFYFDNGEIAQATADAENELTDLEVRGLDGDELGKAKIFKKLKKAVKKAAKKVATAAKKAVKSTAKAVKTVAKSTAKVAKSAVKSAANVVKASANIVKAGAQAAAGKGKAAKATIKKAATQVKKAVVEPVKTAAKATKNIVKVTVVNPTKKVIKAASKAVQQAIKIGKKLFKVVFVKLNPATILIRQSLRLLISLNFLGMATRLNVANMTQAEATKAGYSDQMWQDAKKSLDKVVRFFTKMGGKKANIEKAIRNGAKKKALFKGSYNKNSKIVEKGTDDAVLSGTAEILTGLNGLGAAVTIGSALASVGAFIAKIWKWIKNIVPKIGKGVAKASKTVVKVTTKAAKAVGKGTATAAKAVAKGTAKVAKAVAKGTATAAKAVAKGTAKAAKAVGKGVATVAKKVATTAKDAVKNAVQNATQQTTAQNPVTTVTPVTPVAPVEESNNKSWVPWAVGGALAVGAIIAISSSKKKKRA